MNTSPKDIREEIEKYLATLEDRSKDENIQWVLAYGEKEYLRGREDHIQEENCNCQCSACSDCASTWP